MIYAIRNGASIGVPWNRFSLSQRYLNGVTNISVTDGAYKVGNYNNFSGSRTIALKINGCPTKSSGALAINSNAFPVIGAGASQALTYFAKVSGDAPNSENVQAANVVITISIVN